MSGQLEKSRTFDAQDLLSPVVVFPLFAAQVVGMIVLQKIGLPAGGGKVLAIQLPILLASLGLRFLRYRQIEIDPRRLAFYAIFFCVALLSQVLSDHDYVFTAMIIVFMLYLPATVCIEVDRPTYLRCMNFYQKMMMGVAVIVILQMASQKAVGVRVWPDLEKVLPVALTIPDFNYMREMGYKAGTFQPNGIFFLEPSFVSQFLALAIVIEVVFFERLLVLGLLTVAIFLTFAGTGLLILGLTAPLLITRVSPKLLAVCFVVGIIVAGVGGSLGWFDQFIKRMGELDEQGSSAYFRFYVPYQNLLNSMGSLDSALFGSGAGQRVETSGGSDLTVDIPPTKLMQEYGLPTTIAFYVLFCSALFGAAPSVVVAWALFVFFNLCNASLSLPICATFCITLGMLLRIKREPEASARPSERAVRPAPGHALTLQPRS